MERRGLRTEVKDKKLEGGRGKWEREKSGKWSISSQWKTELEEEGLSIQFYLRNNVVSPLCHVIQRQRSLVETRKLERETGRSWSHTQLKYHLLVKS